MSDLPPINYQDQCEGQAARDMQLARERGVKNLRLPPSFTPAWPPCYEPLRGVYDLRERNRKGAPVRIFDGWEEDTQAGGAIAWSKALPLRQTLEGICDPEVQLHGMNSALALAYKQGRL